MAVRDPHKFREKQKEYRRIVWENEPESAFGLEWVIRMILVYTPWWCFPGNWIKAATDNCHLFYRRTLTEVYVVFKVVIIWWAISNDVAFHGWMLGLLCWSAIETLYALFSGIFLRDLWSEPFSYQRNLLLTLFNYAEICLFFAGVYIYRQHQAELEGRSLFIVNSELACGHHITSEQAIYFSFVTAATIGYGDISPKDPFIQRVVIAQIMVSLTLVVMFIAHIAGKLGTGALAGKERKADQASDQSGDQDDAKTGKVK